MSEWSSLYFRALEACNRYQSNWHRSNPEIMQHVPISYFLHGATSGRDTKCLVACMYVCMCVCMCVTTVLHENSPEEADNWHTRCAGGPFLTTLEGLGAMQIVGGWSENVSMGHENSPKFTFKVKYYRGFALCARAVSCSLRSSRCCQEVTNEEFLPVR